jgi:hypothetical protein
MDLKLTLRNGFLASIVLLICAGGIPSYADSINLIVNGSFEAPITPASSTCGIYADCLGFHNGVAGNDNISGWQLIGKGGVDGDGAPIPDAPSTIMLLGYNYTETDNGTGLPLYFHPQDGLQSVDLTGEGNQGTTNGIKQAVDTNIGSVYMLTFWYGNQISTAPGYTGPSALALYVDGDEIGAFAGAGNGVEDVSWTPYSYQFTASSTQTVIAFLNDTPYGNNFAGLDNVALSTVPEPASFALLVIAVASIAILKHRRKLKYVVCKV